MDGRSIGASMSEAMPVQVKTARSAGKKPAAKRPARKPAARQVTIDDLLAKVRARGQALSVDIKDLLARIG